jgi:hypothetical protein
MGKPVVATKTEAMEMFSNYIYLAEKPKDYPELIEEALVDDNNELKEERMYLAASHTWEIAVEKIYTAINKTLSN